MSSSEHCTVVHSGIIIESIWCSPLECQHVVWFGRQMGWAKQKYLVYWLALCWLTGLNASWLVFFPGFTSFSYLLFLEVMTLLWDLRGLSSSWSEKSSVHELRT